MASGIATANPERPADAGDAHAGEDAPRGRRGGWPLGSRLGRLIVFLNLLGLAILVGGALILNESREGLIEATRASLRTEGQLIANVIDQSATVGDPEPALEADAAANVLQSLDILPPQRVRLFDASGRMITDSLQITDRVEASPLAPAHKPGERDLRFDILGKQRSRTPARAAEELRAEVAEALAGQTVSDMRVTAGGKRVVSESIPIQHVQAVLGVLTLEAGDVDEIIAAQRAALVPFILIAIGVTLLSSLLLTQFVAQPVLRLARAADRVRLSRARAIALPDLARRDDELGDLARSLEEMTHALSERMEAIERFAADVAHELRNPMTSIRSAIETLDLVKDAAPRARLLAILTQDVGRLDRLITDISNASRLDAELSRDVPRRLDLGRLTADICAFYEETARPGETPVRRLGTRTGAVVTVLGREGPLGQVIRNLVDNARSFSPPGGEVRVILERRRAEVVVSVEDDGPGMPGENLETVFERFYTSRPKGAAFGGNSGLGLAIGRQIVEAHGGRIWAENRIEDGAVVGARFIVALPAA